MLQRGARPEPSAATSPKSSHHHHSRRLLKPCTAAISHISQPVLALLCHTIEGVVWNEGVAAGTSHDGSEHLLHDLAPDLRQGWLRRWPGPSIVSAPFFPQVAHAGESTERSWSGRCGGAELSSSGTPDDRVPPSSAGGPARRP